MEKEIIKKAQSDKEFRKILVENPKEALRNFGVQISEEVEVKVVEESPKILYLVLPVNPDELTYEQMDDVTGGGNSCGYNYHYWRCMHIFQNCPEQCPKYFFI